MADEYAGSQRVFSCPSVALGCLERPISSHRETLPNPAISFSFQKHQGQQSKPSQLSQLARAQGTQACLCLRAEGCSLPLQLTNPAPRYSHGCAFPFSSLLWSSAFLDAEQKMPSSVFTSLGHFSAFQLKSNLISVVFESSAGLGRGAAFSLL